MKMNRKTGFTLVEAIIGFLIVSLLGGAAYKVFSYIVIQRNRGSVDLEELQGARAAINYLRRDFRCASPLIAPDATLNQRKTARKLPVSESKNFNSKQNFVPIVISDKEIHFYKQTYDTPLLSLKPNSEQINYRIDKARHCLVRTEVGKEKFFDDIVDVKFELYSHPLKKETPMLLISMKIDAGKGGRDNQNRFFELTTTISSSISNHNLNHEFWNFHGDL